MPLVPIALATGWSSLILFATGIPLNPMSATLGALVIAISTEFSVLLSERFRQERRAGHDLGRGAGAHVPVHRIGGARVGDHRDRRFRRADLVEHHDAARLRARDADRPVGVAASACCWCCPRCSRCPSATTCWPAVRERAGRVAAAAAAPASGHGGVSAAARPVTARPKPATPEPRSTPAATAGWSASSPPCSSVAFARLQLHHARAGERGRAGRPPAALLRRAAGRLDPQRRRQPQPALHAGPSRSARAQRVPAGQARAARAGLLRD